MPKWISWLLVMSFTFFLHASARGETKAFFTSQESVERRMETLMDASKSSIDIALFELRSPGLIRALQRAEHRGVIVRMVLDASHRQDNLSTGEVRWLGGLRTGGHGIMHNKFALFDHNQVVTGSYNWTPGAEHANYENALLTDDKETVQSYLAEFERLWDRAGVVPHSIFHKKPVAPPRRKRRTFRFARKKSKKT
jgi:mitochondrial cardiolipin hydrolase